MQGSVTASHDGGSYRSKPSKNAVTFETSLFDRPVPSKHVGGEAKKHSSDNSNRANVAFGTWSNALTMFLPRRGDLL